jgi:dTDP-4-amino-4,6-dideoxygalactose transaminase
LKLPSPKPFLKPIYITKPLLPDLEKFYPKLEQIWDSGWVTNMGEQHHAFEKRVKNYLRAYHICLFCNGTLALQLACQVLRLSGEVITTPFTFPATAHVLYWNRIQPVFCDIEPDTFNIDPAKIEAMITPNTTAILPVHVFGYPCDTEAIQEIADRHGLKVIYDAAHAFGVEVDGTPIGNFGDISMFSFHATKVFHTIEGGALTFSDHRIRQRLDFAKNFGFKDEETIVVPGINAKMNELQAAVGMLVLDDLQDERNRRKALTQIYRERLERIPGVQCRYDIPNVKHNYYNLAITIDESQFNMDRDALHDELLKYNVITRKYFYPLCSRFQCYNQHPSASQENLAVAERISKKVLILPLYGSLTFADVEHICDIIKYIGDNSKRTYPICQPVSSRGARHAALRVSSS